MKNIIIILLIGFSLHSCSDEFTNLAPISNRNEADFYNDGNDLIAAINSSYAGLQANGVYNRAYWTMFEMRSDNTDQGPDATGLSRQFAEINAFTEDPLNEQITAAWTNSYSVIANCNVILDRIDGVEMDQSLKSRIIGEALFLRSLMYYHLAVAYGNIPLQLVPFAPGTQLQQVDATTVYTQLIADLETAEQNLPVSYPASDEGRATKGAAATLLAKVLLTTEQSGAAEIVLRRIVNDYDYELLSNYGDLFGPGNENNAESIFEVQFISGGIGQGSAFTNDFSPSGDLQNGQGFGRNRPTVNLVEAYENGDERFEASIGTSYINNQNVVVEARYIKKFFSDPPTEYDADNNFIVFRYADVLLMLAEAIGESAESYGYINEVRERANLLPIDSNTPGTFMEKLLNERRLELAFENHRWADIKRFEVVVPKITAAEPMINPSAIRELFYIPQREIDLNPSFTQNSN